MGPVGRLQGDTSLYGSPGLGKVNNIFFSFFSITADFNVSVKRR